MRLGRVLELEDYEDLMSSYKNDESSDKPKYKYIGCT